MEITHVFFFSGRFNPIYLTLANSVNFKPRTLKAKVIEEPPLPLVATIEKTSHVLVTYQSAKEAWNCSTRIPLPSSLRLPFFFGSATHLYQNKISRFNFATT